MSPDEYVTLSEGSTPIQNPVGYTTNLWKVPLYRGRVPKSLYLSSIAQQRINLGQQPIMAVFMTTMILGSTVAIGYMFQPVAAQPIPPSCPPNTQSFERGLCVGPGPTLTYLCDAEPAGLQLIGGDEGIQCVLIDDAGNILYSEDPILVDAQCRGPFPFIEETLQCATRPGGQQN